MIDVEVGLNLRRARLLRKLSQTQLGDALGISFQQIQKYERGVNRLSTSMLIRGARFLGISPVELLPQHDSVESPQEMVRQLGGVRGAAEVVNAYCSVPSPRVRRALLQFIRAVASSEAIDEADAETDAPVR
ncbi:MAG TPA: helix-turn-helix transcriptional regulator [Caulobacteraceae bacterium]|nr:helix-turn-helix transcriptional regulator [Caulobacteraceae bacterium]